MKTLFTLVVILSLVSCATTPNDLSDQITLHRYDQSPHLWIALSKEVAANVKSVIDSRSKRKTNTGYRNVTRDGQAVNQGAVFISEMQNLGFSRAMRSFLITELITQNIGVTLKDNGTYILNWSCRRIQLDAEQSPEINLIDYEEADIKRNTYWHNNADLGGFSYGIHVIFKLRENKQNLMRLYDSNFLYVQKDEIELYSDIPEIPIGETNTRKTLMNSSLKQEKNLAEPK
ncbi:MAG: hypothetical protein QNJ58_12355 [Desulfobacterales bacterium]|nr:hypothetical protein [Desulfobacterales bacterium]